MTDQGINIFDKNHPFFTDLCYDYENILKKDIPLSRRIKDIYPNVSLCDEGCIYESIDLESMTAKCDCKFNDIANNNLINDNEILNSMLSDFFDLINSSNILVLKCIKYMFKHFTRSIGGWISLILIIIFVVMVILYFLIDLKNMVIFVLKFTDRFIEYISFKETKSNKSVDIKENKNIPPKKTYDISNKKKRK